MGKRRDPYKKKWIPTHSFRGQMVVDSICLFHHNNYIQRIFFFFCTALTGEHFAKFIDGEAQRGISFVLSLY